MSCFDSYAFRNSTPNTDMTEATQCMLSMLRCGAGDHWWQEENAQQTVYGFNSHTCFRYSQLLCELRE